MESEEGIGSGVTVIAAEAPSSYHVAPRTEYSNQAAGTQPVSESPVSAGLMGTMEKKKRGRPRKYGPEGPLARAMSPLSISSSAPPATVNFPVEKPGGSRPTGSEKKQKQRVGSEKLGEWITCSGGNFTPHMITVNTGEDVTMKIISFSQQGPRAICIISAVGLISNVTLRQPDSSGGTLTYEGRFEILSLSGSFTPTEVGGSRVGRSGGMSISLASPDGRVVGGLLAGLLIAASPVQVVVGSFLPSTHLELKPKKQKPEPKLLAAVSGPAAYSHASNVEQTNLSAHDQNSSAGRNPNITSSSPFHTENWAMMPTVQDTRKANTDINISLQRD